MKKMEAQEILLWLAIALGVCGFGFWAFSRRTSPQPVSLPCKDIEGTLAFDDIVGKLKFMKLDIKSEVAFLGYQCNDALKRLIKLPGEKAGYKSIIVGVMDKHKGRIIIDKSLIYFARELDARFIEVMGDSTIVKLS